MSSAEPSGFRAASGAVSRGGIKSGLKDPPLPGIAPRPADFPPACPADAIKPLMALSSECMNLALAEAAEAAARGEVPVGAVLVDGTSGAVLAAAGNEVEALADPTAHAEMLVLRRAASLRQSPRLADCDLYVTLEPCPMCAAAIALARVRRLYFAAYDPKGGGVEHGPRIFEQPGCNHRPEIYGGIDEARAAALLRDFFAARR
jgi:tRNA(adenine34) deaminase